MKNLKIIIGCLLLIILAGICKYFYSDTYGSYVWYSEPRAIKIADNIYIGLIDNRGNVKILKKNKNKTKQIINIEKNFQIDEHNHPVFLLLPNKSIMAIYTKHDQKGSFYYKILNSTYKKIAKLNNEKSTITYPNPIILSEDKNHFYLLYRGLNWQPTITKYTLPNESEEITKKETLQIIQSTGKRPYTKYLSDKKNKIHMVYTTGHADNELPNWIYYSVIDINTMNLYDITGNFLANIRKKPFNISKKMKNSPLIVDNTTDSRNCIWDFAFDDKGFPTIAFAKISEDKQTHNYYITKWNGKEWIQNKISNGGSYFHGIKGKEETFSGGLSIDKDNTNIIYASIPHKGLFGKKYEITKIKLDNKLKVISTEQITKNSIYNNVRPYNLKGHNEIFWLNGKYDYWKRDKKHKGFPLKIKYKIK